MKFFVPGRTEIIGNHTDHQKGRVIAAAVKPGIHADCEKTEETFVCLSSEGFGEIRVDLRCLEPDEKEKETSAALIRGMARALRDRGYRIGGFSGSLKSSLPAGGGLSSSAAFSVLVGRIFNSFYNEDAPLDPVTLAQCAQEAENRFFGKPSGLMDQLACALEGAVYIDFLSGEIRRLECDFAAMGLVLCLANTGGSHAGLTEDYAAIPADMAAVAAEYGQELLGYVNPEEFFARACPRDSSHQRAEHFFEENRRVLGMRDAISEGDRAACLRLMNDSGRSSETRLRNILSSTGDTRLQEGLDLSKKLLEGVGAWRVHGGGFAGCVQALVPEENYEAYRAAMDDYFGEGSCTRIM